MVLHQRVVMHIDDTGIGDWLILGVLWANIIAVDDRRDPMLRYQVFGRAYDFRRSLVASVDKHRFEWSAQNTATGVHLVDCHEQAVAEFTTVIGGRSGERHHASDSYRRLCHL